MISPFASDSRSLARMGQHTRRFGRYGERVRRGHIRSVRVTVPGGKSTAAMFAGVRDQTGGWTVRMVGVSSYMRAETGDIRARAIAAAHGFTRCIPLGNQINTDRAWADMCSSWTGGGRRGRWRPNETLGHINTGVPPGESLGLRRGAERCMLSPLTGARPQIKRLGNPPIRSPIRAMLALPSSSTSLYPFLLCYPHHAPPAPKPLPVVGSRTSPVADLPSLSRAPIGGDPPQTI